MGGNVQEAIQALEQLNQTKTNLAPETRTAINKAIRELRMAKNTEEAKRIINEVHNVMQKDAAFTSEEMNRFKTVVNSINTGNHVTSNLLYTLVIMFFILKVFYF